DLKEGAELQQTLTKRFEELSDPDYIDPITSQTGTSDRLKALTMTLEEHRKKELTGDEKGKFVGDFFD
ncbi:unnamed protein product, partial [marine sediment metagenome]